MLQSMGSQRVAYNRAIEQLLLSVINYYLYISKKHIKNNGHFVCQDA